MIGGSSLVAGNVITGNVALAYNEPTGVLPFLTSMMVGLDNLVAGQPRRLAGRIDVLPPSGGSVTNWRAGYTNVAGGQSYTTSWGQNIPALIAP